jgi:hypothetical protein
MHNLSTSFVLGYRGCDRETAEKLLRNEPFQTSENDYDWLGSGIYFWEANPDRALEWARKRAGAKLKATGEILEPFVVGAVIDLGFCLDLISSNGSRAVEQAYLEFQSVLSASKVKPPENSGGGDNVIRKLDCAVINFLHASRKNAGEQSFDAVRGLFPEGKELYPGSGFRQQTHVQICVRHPANIHGVFRVADRYFTR